MSLSVGLNGAGRIGRALLRLLRDDPRVRVVHVNDLASAATVAHLLRHDSVHGPFPGNVVVESGSASEALVLDGRAAAFTRAATPADVPWQENGVDVVVEATGRFTGTVHAGGHLRDAVERCIVTAVSEDADETIVLGIHDGRPAPGTRIVSTASCTTHAAALPLSLLDRWYGVTAGQMTTVHCTTGSQTPMDAPGRDLRRSRSALLSMIPTTTSASRGLALCLPAVGPRISCLAVRVPTATVSLVELVVTTRDALEDVNDIAERFRGESDGPLRGILGTCDEPLVSIDFSGDPHSSIVDTALIATSGSHVARLIAWYDNEWGYASRVADLLRLWAGG